MATDTTSSLPQTPAEPVAPGQYGRIAQRAAVWDLGARSTGQAILFVASMFLARLLTPADFGVVAASRFFIMLASRLTQFGLNASLVRMKEMRDEHVSSVFVTQLVVGVVAFLCVWGTSPFLGRFFSSPDVAKILPVSAIAFLITPFGAVTSALMSRHLRYRAASIAAWCNDVGGALFTVILAWLGFGYWSIVFGALLGTTTATGLKAWLFPWRLSLRFSRSALRDTLSFGIGFQAKQLLVFSTTTLDNVVVGRVLGIVSLGFYDKAYNLMNGLTDRMIFDSALMRIFAMIREDSSRFRTALVKGVQATSLVTFPLLVFAAVTADRLVVTFFGPQWEPTVGPFRVLAVVGMLRTANRSVSAANESLGLVWLQSGLQALDVALLVIGIVVGARWGLTAASIGVLVAAGANSAFSVWLLARHTTITVRDVRRAIFPPLATVGAMAAAVVAVNLTLRHLAVSSNGVLLAGDLVTATITYLALVLFTPFESVRTVVCEGVDELAPWVRRHVQFGALGRSPVAPDSLASTTTSS